MFGIVFTWLKIFLCIGYVSSSAVFNNSKISWNYLLISLSCVWISYNVYALSYHLVSTNYRMFSNLCWKICLWSYDTPLETFTQIFTVYVIFHIFSITTQQSKQLSLLIRSVSVWQGKYILLINLIEGKGMLSLLCDWSTQYISSQSVTKPKSFFPPKDNQLRHLFTKSSDLHIYILCFFYTVKL